MIWYKQRETIVAVVVAAIIGFFIGTVSGNANRVISEVSSPTETATATVTPAPEEPAVPINLAGTGQQATDKIKLKAGLTKVKMTHAGSGNFAIWVIDKNGENVELLVNEIGSFDGSKAFKVPATGEYVLDVSADGAWTVDITQ